MLIGVDASRAAALQRTGTENYTLHLLRSLLELDQQNRYRLYFNQRPADGLFPPSDRCEERIIPFPRLWTHLRLAVEMARSAPDVLFVPAHVLPVVHPRRSVVTVHDLGYLYYPQAHTPWAGRYLRWSTAYNAANAAHILADSVATRDDLVKHGLARAESITVAYPGLNPLYHRVEDERARRAVLERHQITFPYVLYVGTLHSRKNLNVVLEALRELVKGGLDLHWVIAGKKGWLYEPLFARVHELGLDERVHFLGFVADEDLPALFSGALAFVLPSLYEGFGFPVLEAMACGCPVLCSNASSVPEVAGDAAVLLDPHDAGQWAEALSSVLTDQSLRQGMIERGYRQSTRFTWPACAATVLRVLEMVGKG
ncbi:MAG TPA: glycosyltransferase family 1 protein [Anaerolineae bacterium]|nr:glycosyltransferase family 1 protein [Anaerolineae bacterium]HNT04686.1 glycosyltransferase family 1 protein [Anaerolineae bacterium]